MSKENPNWKKWEENLGKMTESDGTPCDGVVMGDIFGIWSEAQFDCPERCRIGISPVGLAVGTMLKGEMFDADDGEGFHMHEHLYYKVDA